MSSSFCTPAPHTGEGDAGHVRAMARVRRIVGLLAVGAALFLLPASHFPRTLHAQAPSRGKLLYDQWCAECHGETGGGDGSAAAYMLPRPRDFTRALYQVRTTASGELPTDADIRWVIDEGMPGTAMPGWKSIFYDSDRDALVEYVKSFSRFFGSGTPQPLDFSSKPGGGGAAVAEGRQAYQTLECFKCHGEAGRGDGPSAPTLTDDWDFPVRAADLTASWLFNGGPRVEDVYRRLRTGLDGTPMPSFSDAVDGGVITDEQLWYVAHYVVSLAPARAPSGGDVLRAVRIDGPVPGDPTDEAWSAVTAAYVPLVGQIIEAPRWFAPRVDGAWVSALHDGRMLALKISWNDPSRSPDPSWQEWLDRMSATMTDVDGPVPTAQGPDRMHVQFPLAPSSGMERPYFLGGDARRPVFQWRWSSGSEGLVEGTATGWERFTARGNPEATSVGRFQDGRWEVVIARSLVPADTLGAPAFHPGRAIPIAFFAADGSNGEDAVRGALSAWVTLHLEVATPATAFVAPVVTALLTVGLGLVVVARAQRRARTHELDNATEEQ